MENAIVKKSETNLDTQIAQCGVYCSLPMETPEEKRLIFNATSDPDLKLKECVNKTIALVGVYIEPVEMKNNDPEDAEENPTRIMPRMILIDDKGHSYSAISTGAYNAMKRIFALYGTPETWTSPLKVMPIIKQVAKGQTITFNVV